MNQEKAERYVIFNNITESVDGSLLEAPPEGALQWVPIGEVANLPMLPSFKRRFPFFFEPGTFEIHTKWDENGFEETILRM